MRFTRLALTSVAILAAAGTVSCSDPVPPTPQGAWAISFQPPDTNPSECQIAGHNSAIGSVGPNKRDKVLVDGAEGASIECSVIGTGKFNVTGKGTQSDKGLELRIDNLAATATEDAPLPGSVSYASINTAGNPYASTQQDMPCQFWFSKGTPEGIAAGRVWVAFKCPVMIDASTGSSCQIKSGFAIFENCTQSAGEE